MCEEAQGFYMALLCSRASRILDCRTTSLMRGTVDVKKLQAGGLTVLPFMA